MISALNYGKVVRLMVVLVLLLLVSCGIYAAWDPFRASEAEERQQEVVAARGAHLFAQYCTVCHGKTGEGGVGPPLNTPNQRPPDPTDLKVLQAKLTQTIRCGRVGTLMPPWHLAEGGALNDEQIRQLVLLITTDAGGAWERAAVFFDELADTEARLAQGRAVTPQDTVLRMRKAENLSVGGLIRLDEEVLEIVVLDKAQGRLEVKRGVQGTIAAQHPDGSKVFTAPLPPPTGPINEGACGQRLAGAGPAEGAPGEAATLVDSKLVITGGERGARNLFFTDRAEVPAGQEVTIEFQNQGKAIHNLVIQGTNFKSEQVVAGGKTSSFRVRIERAGSYKFICEYHQPEMTGTLTVKAP